MKTHLPSIWGNGPRQIEFPVVGNVLPPSSYESPDSQKGMGNVEEGDTIEQLIRLNHLG